MISAKLMHGNRKFSCTKLASMSSLLKFETGRLTFQLGSFLHFYNLLQLVDNFSLYSFYSKRVFWVITKEITVDFQCHTNFAQFSIPKIHSNVSKLGKSQQLQNLILREVVCKLTCNSCGFTPTHSFILFYFYIFFATSSFHAYPYSNLMLTTPHAFLPFTECLNPLFHAVTLSYYLQKPPIIICDNYVIFKDTPVATT